MSASRFTDRLIVNTVQEDVRTEDMNMNCAFNTVNPDSLF
jgi:hypothetical protein